MNENERLKKIKSDMKEEVARRDAKYEDGREERELAAEKDAKERANNAYPTILKYAEDCIRKGQSEIDILNNWMGYHSYHGDDIYNKEVERLLIKDGFIVKWKKSDGWKESEVHTEQDPFDYITFRCK